MPDFSVKATYTPHLAFPKTQKVVVSSKLQRLLECFGQLYNEIHVVRNQKFTQALP